MMKSFDEKTGRKKYFALMDQSINKLIDPETGKIYRRMVKFVDCPLCGNHKNYQIIFVKQGFDFVRCQECGLVYVNPQLKTKYIESLYKEDSTFYSAWTQVLLNEENQKWQKDYFLENLNLLSRYKKFGTLLDIGCSVGLFMQLAQEKGYRCIGLELEKEAFQYAISQNISVMRQTLAEAKFAANSFDVVTMFGVLEHLEQPGLVLKEIFKVLKPGGVVLAIVPNIYSLAAMMQHEEVPMFNGRNHLTYFSLETLKNIFESNGFKIKILDTCLTSFDSIVNYMQFNNPQGAVSYGYLPEKVRKRLKADKGRNDFEKLILENDLGLRARVIVSRR